MAAAAAATIIATTQQGDTLDLVCWRELGTTSGGVVEQAYLLNQNLADGGPNGVGGPLLAPLTDVILPAVTSATPTALETVNLWD